MPPTPPATPPTTYEDGFFKMIDVGLKAPTRRTAQAQGEICLSHAAFEGIRTGTNPKGNVLALAEAAGIMAAKKTADLIPLCHPLPLEKVEVRFELNAPTVVVFCEATTTAKTGVEMEALAGVNGALLSIYDLSKAIDPVISIRNIRLNFKEGGKSGSWKHPDAAVRQNSEPGPLLGGVRASVITISDRVSAGEAKDLSGPAIEKFLKNQGAAVTAFECVPDEQEKIQKVLFKACREDRVQLVITTGGTGLGPRDVTPEAVSKICDRMIPGVGEMLRADGSRKTPMAWLSRSFGAQMGKTLVIALPGSLKAVEEGLETLRPILSHALHILDGGGHS